MKYTPRSELKITTRLDFQINSSLLEKAVDCIGALWGHFGYWNNWDVAAFILNELYPSTLSEEDETMT